MKKIGLQTWLIFIFMLAALAGCGKSAADRWQEQYDLGAQYLLEENYEQAIVAFAAAIEIEPKEIQAYTGLVQGYQQTGDLASADSAVQSGLSVLSEGSGLSVDAQTAFLLAEACSFSQVSVAGRCLWNRRQKEGVSPIETRIFPSSLMIWIGR